MMYTMCIHMNKTTIRKNVFCFSFLCILRNAKKIKIKSFAYKLDDFYKAVKGRSDMAPV